MCLDSAKYLLDVVEMLIEGLAINQDVIKTKEDMEQMRSDVIKDAISIKGRTSRTKAMDKIIEFKQALRYFQCKVFPLGGQPQ